MNAARKPILIVAAALIGAALLVALLFAFTGSGDEPLPASNTTKVGMVLNGSARDGGFTQALHEAAESVCEDMNLEFSSRDSIQAGEFADAVRQAIDEGCGMILCDSESFDEALTELSHENPQVRFINAMGTVKGHNLASCMRRTYQARYLTGIVAGMQTQTNEIGYVVSSLTLETIRQLNAFTIGARKYNPAAKVHVCLTGDRYDEGKAADTMNELLDKHDIDVVSSHAVPTSALAAADARGVWTIGYLSGFEPPFPDTWLTGYLFDWKPFYTQRLEEWRENRFVGQQYRGGIRNGLVSLAPLSDLVKPGIQETVDAETERLMDGTFDIFYGPITDTYGTVQVREGETMSDRQILHGMYWFAEGVVRE